MMSMDAAEGGRHELCEGRCDIAILEIPLVEAMPETLDGYSLLVHAYEAQEIEIVTWPVAGWQQCDAGTGNEGGVTEGPRILVGRRSAVWPQQCS